MLRNGARNVQQMEYAITRKPSDRSSGGSVECPRPDYVRDMARRMNRWKEVGEGCQLCRAENAVSVRSGVAVCGACKANMTRRVAGFDGGMRAAVVPHEQRASESGLSGLAIVFDSLSVDLGGFYERIAPAAVDRTLVEGSDVLQLVDHDAGKPIGRLSAGTLHIRKTARGLANVIPDPPNTSAGKDVMVSVRRSEITGQSFGFMALEDDWQLEGDIVVRTVLDMRVPELSIVTFPAYRATSIEVGQDAGQRDVEFLRKVHRTRLAMS